VTPSLAWISLALVVSQGPIKTVDGKVIEVQRRQTPLVLIFTSTDCPIAKAYSPTLSSLVKRYPNVQFVCVYEDPDASSKAIARHQSEFHIPMAAVLDHGTKIADWLGATTTPEAVLLTKAGATSYKGRIDDTYASIERRRYAATSHDLADAIQQVLKDQPVKHPYFAPVGCAIFRGKS